MSSRRTVEYFSPIEIEISCIDQKTVCEIESTAINAVEQKLGKLNILLKNLDVYCCDNTLLVNDRYGVCKDLEEIARAFGLSIQKVECGLRGKSYILQDALFEIISTLNQQFSVEKFANRTLTEEIASIIKNNAATYGLDPELNSILQTIKETGHYTVKGKQKITTTYLDGRIIDQKVGETVSAESRIKKLLKSYVKQTSEALKKTNENLRDGTVKLLYSRARQMGYAVKEERNGTQVQLVLVRNA